MGSESFVFYAVENLRDFAFLLPILFFNQEVPKKSNSLDAFFCNHLCHRIIAGKGKKASAKLLPICPTILSSPTETEHSRNSGIGKINSRSANQTKFPMSGVGSFILRTEQWECVGFLGGVGIPLHVP